MYRTIMKFGKKKVEKLAKKLNLADEYASFPGMCSEINNVLKSTHYNGPLNQRAISNYISKLVSNTVSVGKHNTIADLVLANESAPKQSDKVDKLFNETTKQINSIDNTPLPQERWVRKNVGSEKEHSRTFEIDFTNYTNDDKELILKNMMKKFWEPFMRKITLEQHWVIKYYVHGYGWRTTSINASRIDKFKEYFDRQNWDVMIEENNYHGSDEVFTCDFNRIDKLIFIDYTDYPNLEKPKRGRKNLNPQPSQNNAQPNPQPQRPPHHGLNNNANQRHNAPVIGKTYRKRQGNFWKWILDLPKNILNLERYQIYNTLDKETVKTMSKEHCLIYALQQYGIPQNITEDIKTYITRGHFPMSKLNLISEYAKINFNVRYYGAIDEKPKYMKFRTEGAKYEVDLLLYEEHYMLDEEIPFNKQYIYLRKQIQENPLNTVNWSLSDILRVGKYRNDRNTYEKLPKSAEPHCSLPELLKALFANGYFKPISMNDYLVYYSSLYKDSLEESSIITINEHDTRLIKDFDHEAIEKNIRKNKEFLASLSKDDYDIDEITNDMIDTINSDPTHNHELQIVDDELIDVVSERKPKPSFIIFADFECSTEGKIHKEYCICADKINLNHELVEHFESFSPDCAVKFIEWCSDGALIYFHNLSYDMNFLLKHFDKVKGNPIIFNGRDMSYKVMYHEKTLNIRDSYALISSKLEQFPSMFKLDSGIKEAFPYNYYTEERVVEGKGSIDEAVKYVKPSLKEQFIHNIDLIPNVRIDENTFDMKKYALFYCNQDVKILREGLCKFRKDMIEALDLDCIESLSISSVADKYFKREIYFKNGNLYEVSGILLKNMSKCVHGGRCMTRDNEKQINENKEICDFDAVSLYPSAIHRLYILEGKPKVIPSTWNGEYIINHLFNDDQLEPTTDKFISGFYVKIHIDSIGVKRHFPLIVFNPALNSDLPKETSRSSNTCCNMWCDHITLMDLIKFQKIKFTLLGGYYYSDKRDIKCREVIQRLFELRLKYKKEDNPLQQVIKLILNSVYGKTILKPIEYKHVFVPLKDSEKYMVRNYNEVVESVEVNDGALTRFKVIKPINSHFNFSPFGINILSMSKRIMNEVFCLAEDLGLTIFYQDTDSGHYYVNEIDKLAEEYEKIYHRKLIGKNLGQFHSDFANISNDASMPQAMKSIFLGKKSYIDLLYDDKKNIGFHARMKGITPNAIVNKANEMFPDDIKVEYKGGLYIPVKNEGIDAKYSIYSLYKFMYDGNEVSFDLVDEYNPRFDMKKDKTITSKSSFIRKVKFG